MFSINRRCPFCNGDIFYLKSERVGFVTQKTLGGSIRQYFHMECFEKAGRGKT